MFKIFRKNIVILRFCKVNIHFVKKARAIGNFLYMTLYTHLIFEHNLALFFCSLKILKLYIFLSFIFSSWVGKVRYSLKNVPTS